MDFEEEIKTLQTEYQKLQAHLADVEVTYQSQLTELNQRQANDFALQLQGIVSSLFGKSQYSDMNVLLSNGEALPVHKLILLARSQNWGTYDFEKQSQLDLRDYRHEVAFDMLKWVYTDRLDIEDDVGFIIELLQIASSYNLLSLHKRCQKMLIPLITLDNCKLLAEEAGKCEAQLLQEQCTEFILKNQEGLFPQVEDVDINFEEEISKTKTFTNNILEKIPSSINVNIPVKNRIPKQRRNHNKSHPFICEFCRTSVVTAEEIKHHEQMHSDQKRPTFSCGLCQQKDLILKRVKSCQMKTGEIRTVCQVCMSNPNSMNLIEKIFKTVLYCCGFCGRKMMCKRHLIDHMNTHTGERPVECDICFQTFTAPGSLYRHRLSHTGEKRFHCGVCGRGFATGAHCRRHARIHSGDKPYKCEQCGKCFTQSTTLDSHRRTHTGEKPHSCHLCTKSFGDRRSLSKHMERFHEDS